MYLSVGQPLNTRGPHLERSRPLEVAGRSWGRATGAEEGCVAFESREHCLSVCLSDVRQAKAGRQEVRAWQGQRGDRRVGQGGLHRAAEPKDHVVAQASLST